MPNSSVAAGNTPRIFASYEPALHAIAAKFDRWPWTNPDAQAYAARVAHAPDDSRSAEAIAVLRMQIRAAGALVCVIGEETRSNAWIEWELREAATAPTRVGLVGVMLQPWNVRPRSSVDSGAIFVPFRRDAVERAIQWALREPHTSGDFELAEN